MEPYLVLGLGNPGETYALTRHNMGFMAVDAFAKCHGAAFVLESKRKAHVAKLTFEEKKLYLARPTTYMNLSGQAALRLLDFYKIPLKNLLVISDDIDLDFGDVRFRKMGSSGGQKGLKNVELTLSTQEYARIRIGIGDSFDGDLASYVLSRLLDEEMKLLPELLNQTVELIEKWIRGELSKAVTIHTSKDGEKNE
ncbi:MAG: aminoacyl-tRNA hydrolase [Simkaniaceae bacterium]